jgi:hypothetical protein
VKDRHRVIDLDGRTRIIIRRSSVHPVEYAFTLVRDYGDDTHAVAVFDNAHGPDEHHEHQYIRADKQPPIVTWGNVNRAMHTAISKITSEWRSLVREWEQESQIDDDSK